MTIRKEENVETRARARIEEIEAMLTTPAYGAVSAKAPLAPLSIERRNPGRRDVQASSPLLKCRDGGYALYPNWQASSLVNGREHGAGESFRWNNG